MSKFLGMPLNTNTLCYGDKIPVEEVQELLESLDQYKSQYTYGSYLFIMNKVTKLKQKFGLIKNERRSN